MENKPLKDTQVRRAQLTINNPSEKGITHDAIKSSLQQLKSTTYYCLADEIGESGTPHTHIYIVFSAPVRFSTIKNLFPTAHIEKAMGTSQENRDYILKTGKWSTNDKKSTSIEDSFEESGELPQERQGAKRADLEELYNMLKAGASDYDIFERNPGHIRYVSHIEKVRQTLAKEEIRQTFRDITVTYIFGRSGVGKTRYVMDTHGYDKVFRVTDYKNPFDNYNSEPVICFDEFSDSIPIRSMLLFCEGYPLELPARYANRWAAYTKVYILSNIPLADQYKGAQYDEKDVWEAFLRRIDTVSEFFSDGQRRDSTVSEYFDPTSRMPDNYEYPF